MTMMLADDAFYISLDEDHVNHICLCDSMCDDPRDGLDMTFDMCRDNILAPFVGRTSSVAMNAHE